MSIRQQRHLGIDAVQTVEYQKKVVGNRRSKNLAVVEWVRTYGQESVQKVFTRIFREI